MGVKKMFFCDICGSQTDNPWYDKLREYSWNGGWSRVDKTNPEDRRLTKKKVIVCDTCHGSLSNRKTIINGTEKLEKELVVKQQKIENLSEMLTNSKRKIDSNTEHYNQTIKELQQKLSDSLANEETCRKAIAELKLKLGGEVNSTLSYNDLIAQNRKLTAELIESAKKADELQNNLNLVVLEHDRLLTDWNNLSNKMLNADNCLGIDVRNVLKSVTDNISSVTDGDRNFTKQHILDKLKILNTSVKETLEDPRWMKKMEDQE